MDERVNGGYLPNLTDEEKAALLQLKEGLTSRFGRRLAKFVLYGSKARGDYGPESDLDVAIIIHALTGEEKKKIFNAIAEIELEHLTPLSTLVLDEEEFDRLRGRERRIALDIETEGIPL